LTRRNSTIRRISPSCQWASVFPGLDAKGGDLPPRRECAPAWRDRLMAASMPQVRLILAIGQYAQAWHLGPMRRKSLTETVADWRGILAATQSGRAVLPLPHPSWRNSGWIKQESLVRGRAAAGAQAQGLGIALRAFELYFLQALRYAEYFSL
jgi:uracil-DNA glycosylase